MGEERGRVGPREERSRPADERGNPGRGCSSARRVSGVGDHVLTLPNAQGTESHQVILSSFNIILKVICLLEKNFSTEK